MQIERPRRRFDSHAFRDMMQPHAHDEPAPPPWSCRDEIEAAVGALAVASKQTDQAAYQLVIFAGADRREEPVGEDAAFLG
jgi:hypothetical protein